MNLKKSEIISLSERYALALYSAAKDKGQEEKICQEFIDFSILASENDDISNIISNPSIKKNQVSEVIEAVLQKLNISEFVVSFISVLGQNRRLALLTEIAERLKKLLLEKSSTIVAQVYSTHKLSKENLNDIAEQLKSAFGKNVSLENIIDKSILGGLKVKIGSLLFDDSLFTKLQKLKYNFSN
ncbi:MAG TPA: ATP synthase F1 subunit delta [Alphaproteobacteria bacterium]|nr:ATP synthase F1 subunit delta [Alphaproteobacteria bacterium]